MLAQKLSATPCITTRVATVKYACRTHFSASIASSLSEPRRPFKTCSNFYRGQGVEKPQGTSDDDPIVLTGDTVEEFRSLCWALYALPDELAKADTTPDAYMEKLAQVATLSHKYQLASFQSWSMTLIRRHCVRPSGSALMKSPYLNNCPPHLLPLLICLSILYGEDGLLTSVTEAWVVRLTTPANAPRSLFAPKPLPISAFSRALAFAEHNSLRSFLGQLYYARLQVAHRDSGTSTLEFPFGDLETQHLQPILRGS
ncbi:hypothetical protein FB451DRAFT_1251115 [Mycena latifolia]|nr:hypothetical protein FB451DRAFT_1251115 [Mycena latifolia]